MAKAQVKFVLSCSAAVVALASGYPAAYAQEAPAAAPQEQAATNQMANPGDIIVTARKRQETLLNVPVIEQVVTSETLARTQTVDLKDLTKLTPGLLVGTTVLSIGQQVSLRGVGTSSFDPGIDQSVSLNIDGLSLGQGLAFTSGMFDVGQVEVLKGPQALFFGKSSPGGVISLRTNDPTDKFEVIGSAAYETEARTRRGELIVSGPLSDTLKARIAGMYTKSDGYYFNEATGSAALGSVTPRYDRMARTESYQIRGTLLWNPMEDFDARLKVNYVHDNSINAEQFQLTGCPDGVGGPFGIPFINPKDTCTKNRVGYIADLDPAHFPGVIHNGIPFVESRQIYSTLEMNAHFIPHVTLTSVTGIYDLKSHSMLNTSNTGFAGPLLAAENPAFRRFDFTEEVRATSDFEGPLNFTLGGFYQFGRVSDHIVLVGNTNLIPGAAIAPLQDGLNRFKIETYSAFGQLRYQITPQLELAAGARYTDESRDQNPVLNRSLTLLGLVGAGALPASALNGYAVPVPTPHIHSSNVAPEVTLTYKPSDDLTLFASYKVGYKSGSFSIATPPTFEPNGTWLDNSFGDEKVQGGEAGIKGRLFDRQLNFSIGAWDYLYKGLQVGGIEPTVGSLPVIRTVNAGKGRTYGVEADVHFRPHAIEGLTLNFAGSYTHARFSQLNNVPCYGGQTVAAGCNQQFVPNANPVANPGGVTVNGVYGFYFAQDLSGAPFIRAPEWQATFGFDYELPVGGGKTLILSNSNYYTSKFLTAAGIRPDFYQKGYLKDDVSLALRGEDDRWEVALIGKNITRKYTGTNCSPSNFANGLLGGEVTGGTGRGPAGSDEIGCYMDPGREFWIRLTVHPFN